ncbi:PrgI family protein [Candidatus Peregrinibacteria bacterium]|nr:PrgI family protein [Candidatus Peregrinibacteria bacterium]
MADKIVGPLTLKQLIIVGVGGGLDYFIYISLAKVYILTVWILPVAIVGLITLGVAFLKIKGIPFTQFVLLAIEHQLKPRKRIWTAGAGEVFVSVTHPRARTKEELEQAKQQEKAEPKDLSNLDELTQVLDTHSDILEAKHEGLQKVIQQS